MTLKKRKLSEEDWPPWIGEDYKKSFSTMMIEKTNVSAVSTRLIKLEPTGHTETHSHDRVHHVLCIDGEAILETDKEKMILGHHTLVEISAQVPHRFINKTETPAVILVINLFK